MILIVCVDDRMGMSFCGRRQSQDRLLRVRVLERTAGAVLWMNGYSAGQFGDAPELRVDEAFLQKAGAGAYCFAENVPLHSAEQRIEKLILYRWNRRYPADRYLDLDLQDWRLETATDFPGYSHERITEEVYIK